ncbi:MAG TPA: ketoacyl-ACP synthase III family protein [Actinoplanes sp.]|nr:ketoacyl-ACP synthase III family protein [Actinoplanes sp.]
MKVGDIYVAGIATANPDYLTVEEAVRRGWCDAADAHRTGLASISYAGETAAPDLAVEAALTALAESGVPSGRIAATLHTNVHPQGPDGWSAPHYINHRTINQPIMSAEVRNGCIGFLSALDLGACLLRSVSGRDAVLVTCADNFGTAAVDRWRSSKLFVLGDGGGAAVLSKAGGFARVLAVGSGSDPAMEVRHRGAEQLFPPGLTAGGTLNFQARTDYVQLAQRTGVLPALGDFCTVLVDTVEQTLDEAGVKLADITRVVHDGFNREPLQDIFLDPLGIDPEVGIWEFTRTVGHAGPLDQLRGLEYLRRTGAVGPGDKVLMFSDAPGMEAACAVLEIVEPLAPISS